MSSLPLSSGENIIKQAAGIGIKGRKYDLFLTNRRLILDGGGGALLEFPLGQVEGVSPGEEPDGQPNIRIAVRLQSGEIRDLVLAFVQVYSSRTGERDDWVSALGKKGYGSPVMQAVRAPEIPRPRPEQVRPSPAPGAGQKFCPSCGSMLSAPQPRFCPSCGNQLSPGAASPARPAPPPVPPAPHPASYGSMPPEVPARPAAFDPLGPGAGGIPPMPATPPPPPFHEGPAPARKGHKKKQKPQKHQKLPVRKQPKQKVMKKSKPRLRDTHYGSPYSSGGIDPLYADTSTLGKKITGFVFHPRATFSSCRYDSAGDAFRYFLIVNVIFSVATVAWIFLLSGYADSASYPRLAGIYGGGAESFITTVIELYLYGIVTVFVAGLMLHIALVLSTGGSDPKETFRIVFYAGTAYGAAALIPVAGIIIGPLWLLLLETLGVSESHNLSTGSAAIPVIISAVLIGVVVYVLHIMGIFTFGLMRVVV